VDDHTRLHRRLPQWETGREGNGFPFRRSRSKTPPANPQLRLQLPQYTTPRRTEMAGATSIRQNSTRWNVLWAAVVLLLAHRVSARVSDPVAHHHTSCAPPFVPNTVLRGHPRALSRLGRRHSNLPMPLEDACGEGVFFFLCSDPRQGNPILFDLSSAAS